MVHTQTLAAVLLTVFVVTILIIVLLTLFMARREKGRVFDANLLTLTPVPNTNEPSILTYTIPFNIDVESKPNRWFFSLRDNGELAKGYDFIRQTNGTYLVEWNTMFASPGIHVLQVKLERFQIFLVGPKRTENVTNWVQFDRGDTSFGGQACITGKLRVSSADYRIEIYDETNNLLRTIVGHTDKGTFEEIWDLKTAGGQVRADPEFEAKIYITPTPNGANNLATSNATWTSIAYPFHLCRTGNLGIGAYR